MRRVFSELVTQGGTGGSHLPCVHSSVCFIKSAREEKRCLALFFPSESKRTGKFTVVGNLIVYANIIVTTTILTELLVGTSLYYWRLGCIFCRF